MYILGTAILNQSNVLYNGHLTNIKTGEVFVSNGNVESQHNYTLIENIISKVYQGKSTNLVYGYIGIDELGNLLFVSQSEAKTAVNLKEHHNVICACHVMWNGSESFMYNIIIEDMLNFINGRT